MELQRGVCSLCSENGKVLAPSDAEEYNKFLPRILYENFLTEQEFQRIKHSLKICAICCYKIQTANETKKAITNTGSSTKENSCHFCQSDKLVIKAKDDWKYFTSRFEGFLKPTDYPVSVCSQCLFYFDTIFNMKTKLTYKFPHLAIPSKLSKGALKQNETPKRTLQSKSPPSSKKRKIFNDCFTYLQPLCNNNYYVDEDLKTDSKLYRKIAYVNVKNVKNEIKGTPKVRPVIKIKLKSKSKKVVNKDDVTSEDLACISTRPFVKLCKSEEVPNKVGTQKTKARRQSLYIDEKQSSETEDNLEETPKAATTTNLVPKRRVSLFEEPRDVDNEDKEESQPDSEDIMKIVDKYKEDSTFNDNNKLDLLEDVQESKEDDNIEKNGVELSTNESSDDGEDEGNKESDDLSSEKDTEEITEEKNDLKNNEKTLDHDSSFFLLSLDHTPTKNESSNEGSDSDESDKFKNKSNLDRDSLNGSERKKKRVTFSDEVN